MKRLKKELEGKASASFSGLSEICPLTASSPGLSNISLDSFGFGLFSSHPPTSSVLPCSEAAHSSFRVLSECAEFDGKEGNADLVDVYSSDDLAVLC